MNLNKTGGETAVQFGTDINLQLGNVINLEIKYFCLSSGFKARKITRRTNNTVLFKQLLK